MNERNNKDDIERGRMRTRTAAFLILLSVLCATIFLPGVISGDAKNNVIGGLINLLGVAFVFYFKQGEG